MEETKEIDIKGNWEKFVVELLATKRDGVEKLIEFLETKTDIKEAPASTKFHLNVKGGLVEHSLNVLRFIREAQAIIEAPDISEENLTLSALLHDLCKVNYYVEGEAWDKEWKDKTNEWRKMKIWLVDDKLPLGHGEKSLILAVRYVPLKNSELAAIRWHLGGFEPGINFGYPTGYPFRSASDQYPLVKLLIIADMMAEAFESFTY